MSRWLTIISLVLLLPVGCEKGGVTMKPDESAMLGTWVPDKRYSNCPGAWMAGDTVLVLKPDGLCEAHNFGKGFFFEDYSDDYNQGTRGVVFGKWQLTSDEGKWGLRFDFTLPTGAFRREAKLIELGQTTLIDFRIGWPDTTPRLVLRKSPDQLKQPAR